MAAIPRINAAPLRALEEAIQGFVNSISTNYIFPSVAFQQTRNPSSTPAAVKVLSRLEKHEERLASLERSLQAARATLRRQRSAFSAAVYSIGQIPNEILLQIFSYLVRDDDTTEVLTLSHVCHHWQQVVRRQGSFWADVDLLWPKQKFDLWAERSGNVGLHARLSLNYGYWKPGDARARANDRKIEARIRSHQKYASSTTSLRLCFDDPSWEPFNHTERILKMIFDPELNHTYDILQTLRITVIDRIDYYKPYTVRLQTLPPSVKILTVVGAVTSCDCAYDLSTDFDRSKYYFRSEHERYRKIVREFAYISPVTSLDMQDVAQLPERWFHLFVSLVKLEQLSLRDTSLLDLDNDSEDVPGDQRLQWLLDPHRKRTEFKALQVLYVDCRAPLFHNFFTSHHAFPALRVLQLHLYEGQYTNVIEMMKTMPHLESLHLIFESKNPPPENFIETLGNVTGFQELEIDRDSYDEIRDHLRAMIAQRLSTIHYGMALRRLKLKNCWNEDRAWFEERVDEFECEPLHISAQESDFLL